MFIIVCPAVPLHHKGAAELFVNNVGSNLSNKEPVKEQSLFRSAHTAHP